jgi:rod shape-determining protein MreD
VHYLKILLYLLAVLLLQTVVLPRLNFFGVIPDLFLVSAIVFAILEERTPATFFSAAAGFIQDIFSFGAYLNIVVKVMASNIVSSLKEEFMGDEYQLAAGLVALFTPAILIMEGLFFYFWSAEVSAPLYFIFRLIAATLYNLLVFPLVYKALKRIVHGN